MSKKKMLAALTVAFACGALASPAMATVTPEIELPESHSFTVSGGEARLETSELEVKCKSVTGSGEFENSTTGTILIRYEGCKVFGLFNCTTSGQSAGNITTTTLQLHLKPVTEGKAAVLITPKESHFATFVCAGITTKVGGNGLIGVITSPEYEKESSTVTISFSGKGGTQNDMTVEGEGTKYDLTATTGGVVETADVIGEAKMEFGENIVLVDVRLNVTIVPMETGTVEIPVRPPVLVFNCKIFCSAGFAKGKMVQLTVENGTKKFKEWRVPIGGGNPGTCVGAATPCNVLMNANVKLEAIFE